MIPVPSDMYYHEQDRQTLEALKAIPGFTIVLKKFMEVFSESITEGLDMAMKIRLGPNQLPDLYNLLPPICKVLGIQEPQFYLEMSPEPNAYTTGDTKTFVTITSGLVDMMSEEELSAVIAHECGHIACHHVLYSYMASVLLSAGSSVLGLGLLTLPLQMALAAWQRCSEFSADRAAAVYMKGSEGVENVMMRLSSGDKDLFKKIDKQLYMKQAEAYQDMLSNSKWNKALQYYATMFNTHPLTSVRAFEINRWCRSGQFNRILDYMNGEGRLIEHRRFCPNCGVPVQEGFRFCKSCGTQL